jgi:hypothetical protein
MVGVVRWRVPPAKPWLLRGPAAGKRKTGRRWGRANRAGILTHMWHIDASNRGCDRGDRSMASPLSSAFTHDGDLGGTRRRPRQPSQPGVCVGCDDPIAALSDSEVCGNLGPDHPHVQQGGLPLHQPLPGTAALNAANSDSSTRRGLTPRARYFENPAETTTPPAPRSPRPGLHGALVGHHRLLRAPG